MDLVAGEGLLIAIFNKLGVAGSMITLLSIMFGPYIFQLVKFLVGKKLDWKKKSEVEKCIEDLIKAVDYRILQIVDNQEIIMNTLNASVHLAQAIEYKLKNIISETDSINMLRLFFNGSLYSNLIEKSMALALKVDQSTTCKDGLKQVLIDQFRLEMTNIWNEFLTTLDDFDTPIKMGLFVKEHYSESFFKENTGLLNKIITLIVDTTKDQLLRRDQVKAMFNQFASEVLASLTESFKKYETIRKSME
jgi:hypothetical protein